MCSMVSSQQRMLTLGGDICILRQFSFSWFCPVCIREISLSTFATEQPVLKKEVRRDQIDKQNKEAYFLGFNVHTKYGVICL